MFNKIQVKINKQAEGSRHAASVLMMQVSNVDFGTAAMLAHRGGVIMTIERHLDKLVEAGLTDRLLVEAVS